MNRKAVLFGELHPALIQESARCRCRILADWLTRTPGDGTLGLLLPETAEDRVTASSELNALVNYLRLSI